MQSGTSRKQMVYNAVFEDIIEGCYKPNDIITESGLVEKYSVSKAPVREALIELCKDNLLQSLPRMGYRVISMSLSEIVDLIDFRLDIELVNLRKVNGSLRPEDLESLRKNELDNALICSQEVVPNWMRNQRFHLNLCRLAGNNYAYKVLEEVLLLSSRFVAQYFTAAWANANESQGKYHFAVIDALETGDISRAEAMLRDDILAVKQELQRILR